MFWFKKHQKNKKLIVVIFEIGLNKHHSLKFFIVQLLKTIGTNIEMD